MEDTFEGIRWMEPIKLGVSQLYLSEAKLKNIERWFDPSRLDRIDPLPVHDFGDGRLTLTDGHTRAFTAYRHGVKVPVSYDTDDLVTGDTGRLLYQNDIIWCRRFHISSVAGLEGRILTAEEYRQLWIGRCERAYHLLTKTSESGRLQMAQRHEGLFLYGANENLTKLYFENIQGELFEYDR